MTELADIKNILDAHLKDEAELRATVQKIESNHLTHIQTSMTELAVHVATIAANQTWLMNDVKTSTAQIKNLVEWRDTFNGKMLGFGAAIAAASAVLSFVLNNLL